MFFHPTILALYMASISISFLTVYAAHHAVQILKKWNLQSGDEIQLILERKTYLISTLLAYVLGFQLLSLFLYIFTADQLHPLFVGAMCAAGTLNANSYGYPALLLKMATSLLAGLWLILNHADRQAYDYPLIRAKYSFLLFLIPLLWVDAFLQSSYLIHLRPNIITSCCGSLFRAGEAGLSSEIASLPSAPMKVIFYGTIALSIVGGLYFSKTGRGGYLSAVLSALTLLVSLAAIISFISVYYYELPAHHCPFCILQKEYGYIGYFLYGALFGGAVSGMGVGVLQPFRKIPSLAKILPALQRRLSRISWILFLIFALLVTYRMIFTDFILEG